MSFHDVIKKHISYQAADDVAEICKPLFEKFSFNYFSYTRIYPGNSILHLNSSRAWLDYYWVQNNYPGLMAESSGAYLWATTMLPQAINDGVAYVKLHNGIFIQKIQKNFIEAIELASPNQYNYPIEFYCNNKDFLNQFIFYFKNQAQELIKKADKDRLSPPVSLKKSHIQLSSGEYRILIKTKKNRMNFSSQEIIFSPREFEVLSLLAEGQTMKQAARLLNISPRTIETHLENAKNKTCSYTTMQLIDSFRDNLF